MKLNDESYEIMSIKEKYNKFRVPTFKILIENTDIVNNEHMAIKDIYVSNSIDKSDFFRFSVINAYEANKSTFKWKENYLIVGNKVEVKLGYGNTLETVFKGYITSITYNFTEKYGARVDISGMDASFLMMKGKKSSIWIEKKHSDIVDEIAKKYGFQTEIKDTSTVYDTVVQNNQTDYNFLRYLADLNSCEVFVSESKLYFREINSNQVIVISLKLGDDLIDFGCTEDLGEQISGVMVTGYNIKKQQLEHKADSVDKINKDGSDSISILKNISGENAVNYIFEPLTSINEAEKMAKAFLNKVSMDYVQGEGTTVGIPEIVAGKYIEIKGMFNDKSRIFYIREAIHIFNSSGYTTRFILGGNSV